MAGGQAGEGPEEGGSKRRPPTHRAKGLLQQFLTSRSEAIPIDDSLARHGSPPMNHRQLVVAQPEAEVVQEPEELALVQAAGVQLACSAALVLREEVLEVRPKSRWRRIRDLGGFFLLPEENH